MNTKRAQELVLRRWIAGVVILAVIACGPGPASTATPTTGGPAVPAETESTARSGGESANQRSAPSTPAAQRQLLKPLKVQVAAKTAVFSYLYVGKNLGIFEQHGFDVELLAMPSATASAALQANELDFMATIGTATRAALRGLPLRVVFVESTGPDFVLVGAKGLTAVEQLRGKVVAGVGPASNVNAITIELLRTSGIMPNEYQIVNVGDNAPRAAAVIQDIASAALLDTPSALPLLREGYPMLDRAAGKVGLLFTGLAANTGALQRNRDFLREALQATLDSSQALHTLRERAVVVIAQEFELSVEDAGVVYEGLRPGWTANGKPDLAALQFQFEMDQRELELPEPVRPEQVFDLSLLDEAQARR